MRRRRKRQRWLAVSTPSPRATRSTKPTTARTPCSLPAANAVLKNVEIFIIQTNDTDGDVSDASTTVDLTVQSGNTTALAGCLNAVKKGDKVYQQNKCKNKAFAQGSVRLKNVDITIVQENL